MRSLRRVNRLPLSHVLRCNRRCCCSCWSLARHLDQPTRADDLLTSLRTAAAASAAWDLDFSALLERGAAVTEGHAEAEPSELMGRVGAALAGVLHSPPAASRPTPLTSTATTSALSAPAQPERVPPSRVRTLRITLPTPAAVRTVLQLAESTPLFDAVTSVELVVERSAVGLGEQDAMEAAAGPSTRQEEGGSDLAQLFRVLAARSAQTASWAALKVETRDTSAAVPMHPHTGLEGRGDRTGAREGSTTAQLFAQLTTSHHVWGDATVHALSTLVQSKAWSQLSLLQLDCRTCNARTRHRLWAAIAASSAASLTHLHLTGTHPAREVIGTGVLRHLRHLASLDLGATQLEEDAVSQVLKDVCESPVGGWWRLRHLGLGQCEVTDEVICLMAEQLRAYDEGKEHKASLATHIPVEPAAMKKNDPSADATRVSSATHSERTSQNRDVQGGESTESATSTATSTEISRTEASGAEEKDKGKEEESAFRLTSLDIAGAQLGRHDTAFTLAGCLVRCHALRHVNTRHCRLTKDGVAHLAASLQHATELESWTLCLNRFADDGVSALVKQGKYWPNLKEVDLTRCRLTCAGVAALSAVLPSWDRLEVLRLVGNDLRCPSKPLSQKNKVNNSDFGKQKDVLETEGVAEGNGAGGMSDDGSASTGLFAYDPAFMKQHGGSGKVPTSYELDRRDRQSGRRRYRGTEAIRAAAAAAAATAEASKRASQTPLERFGESLATSLQLRVLDFSDCALTDDGFTQLTTYFGSNGNGEGSSGGGACSLHHLRELRLSANPLFRTLDGLDRLAGFLAEAPQLTTLDLSCTGLGDLGVSMLCDGTSTSPVGALTCMTQLDTLELSSCGVHSLGWESLAAAVTHWPALRHLALHHNTITEESLLIHFLEQLASKTATTTATAAATLCVPQLRSVGLMNCVADPQMRRRVEESDACRALRKRGVQLLF